MPICKHNMNKFDQYFEEAKYLIGYKVTAVKSGVRRFISQDGKLTANPKEAFVFNVKNTAMQEVLKGFEKQYKDLGYDLHYNRIYETRKEDE